MAAKNPLKSFLDGLTPSQRITLGVLVLIVAGAVALVRWRMEQPGPPPVPGETLANRNVRFGMPAAATHDPANRNAYLIERPQYVLSYNDSTKTPNWVCWNVNKGDIGETPRGAFTEDPDLPPGFRRVTTGMYTGSGFDRGHLCPSKDRTDSAGSNQPLFYMTNIMPQSPAANRGAWERFESYCRKLTDDGSELYIACGPHGQGGTGDKGPAQTVGNSVKIVVPAASWKTVLVLPHRDAVPTTEARALAVWVPNEQSVPEDWKPYAVSVATVEQRTGYKFFPLVPDEVANVIKSREP